MLLYLLQVYDYLDVIEHPMDFEQMLTKLDDGEYNTAQDFLDDIDLIAANALKYNGDPNYETNKILCHRAKALQDFSYALVKAEMDTDFEDECKDIVERRKKLTKKLSEMPATPTPAAASNATANNGTPASQQKKRHPRKRVSAWARGTTPSNKKRRARVSSSTANNSAQQSNDEESGEEEEEEDNKEEENVEQEQQGRSTRRDNRSSSNSPRDLARTSNMVPTGGVRIDQSRLKSLQEKTVRITDGYNVESLERTYTALENIVASYSAKADRTQLPSDIDVKLKEIQTAR